MAAPARRVLVLGGGASGLSAAWHLSRAGGSRVVLAEASGRLGGWVESVRVPAAEGAERAFLLERGPRSLRGSGGPGRATWALLQPLGLRDRVLPAAGADRFLWTRGALRPLAREALPAAPLAAARELWAAAAAVATGRRGASRDVSLRELLSWKLGEDVGGRLASAMAAGIYAGDASTLSVRAAFPAVAALLDEGGGSLALGMLRRWREGGGEAGEEEPPPPAVYSFRNGMGELTAALEARVRGDPACEVRLGARVAGLRPGARPGTVEAEVGGGGGEPETFDAVLSTVAAPALAEALAPGTAENEAAALRALVPYVSVDVVNLCYRRAPEPRDEAARRVLKGFGFLVPDREEGAPEGLLGVAVDSSVFPSHGQPGELRLTVMMGGARAPLAADPSAAAVDAVKRCLGLEAEPDLVVASRAEQCIPQFPVGFAGRRDELAASLARRVPGLHLGGATFGGVSVNDCLASGAALAEAAQK